MTDLGLAGSGTVPRPEAQLASRGSGQRLLAALTIVLLPLGNLATVGAMGRAFPIPVVAVAAAALFDPFLEAFVGGLIAFAAATLVLASRRQPSIGRSA